MLKKLFKLFASNETTTLPKQRVITQDQHGIQHKDISQGSLKVIQQLQKAGFDAYLVGGGVRDLLLGGKPKDFDVATNAKPEQVNKLFKSGRIIGRRFKIVHVRFGREIIEVTTFRGSHTKGKGKEAVQAESGQLLRDNVYGTIQSDAVRRDFTINALYYNPTTDEVIDFCNGMSDIQSQTIRIIGDASERYKEDPVRMIRAVRFAAKLRFDIEADTEAALYSEAELLGQIPAARLFEEVLKLFANGYAVPTFALLRQYKLFAHLFPATDYCLNQGDEFAANLVNHSLINTDKRINSGKRITPAFIYAVFLWPPLQASLRGFLDADNVAIQDAFSMASQGVISQQLTATSIPKRFLFPMKDIWHLQHRLAKRDRRRAFSVLEHARFRAAYDFLLLREQAGEEVDGLGKWWTQFQFANEEDQNVMIDALQDKPKRKPRKRKPRKALNNDASAATQQNTDSQHNDQKND